MKKEEDPCEEFKICEKMRVDGPLIHCITNPISMMQCANAVLGLGCKPIMAEHPDEVREITKTASSLFLNLGNISESKMSAMEISTEEALSKRIPIVLDAVGVACSELRREFVLKLLSIRKKCMGEKAREDRKDFFVIKGNYSEIRALSDFDYRGKGVDADRALAFKDIVTDAKHIADRYGIVVLASGKTDIVTDGSRCVSIEGGVPIMGNVTGTGCMLGAICTCFVSACPDIDGIIYSCLCFDLAAESALDHLKEKEENYGNGSFLIKLLDEIYLLTDERIKERLCLKSVKNL